MTAADGLSSRKRALVASLAEGRTKQEAAETVGVRPQTVSRYLRDPAVRAALKKAQDEQLDHVAQRMTRGSNRALDVIEEVMTDEAMPSSVRLRAAQGWLQHAWKALELHDLSERVAALEKRMTDERTAKTVGGS